jgi:hypothetical protein
MLVWDNQQETSWFTGILEAEGSCVNTHGTSGQQIQITNTDLDILNHCKIFLDKKVISYGLYDYKPKNGKILTQISVCGKNNCYSLLKWIDYYFQCRKEEFYEKLQLGSSTTTRDATLTSDLHWLVGMFEGEGCLTLDQERNTYAPKVRFVNTNKLIIEKYIKTLRDNGLSWYIYNRKSAKYKDSTEISMTGLLRCKRFLTKLEGLWRSEKYAQRASKLLRFFDLRLSAPKGSPYTQEQKQIYLDLKS